MEEGVRGVIGGSASTVERKKVMTNSSLGVIIVGKIESSIKRLVIEHAGSYEEMLMFFSNKHLRGRFDCYSSRSVPPIGLGPVAAPVAPVVKPVAASACVVVALLKPVESWAVVVREKGRSKEPSKTVAEDVSHTFGVRVHEVRLTRGVGDKIDPRVVAQKVHSEIPID